MAFGDKESYYNRVDKAPSGGSSHLTVDEAGRVFSVFTPHDSRLNSKVIEIEDASAELVDELQAKRQEALAMLQKVVFDPDNADRELRTAADRVFLEDSGIDPSSIDT